MARSRWHRSREKQEEGVMSALEPVQLERLRDIGNLLKQEREKKGMALDDVSAKTLIRPGILKAIEEADARPLPEPVYLKGFIRRYGDLLGLPGIEIAESFPWNPSQEVPSMFVAAAVTTADSVDDPRRPFSAPRSEARVVEPDPVLPEEPEEATQALASQADAPLVEAPGSSDITQAAEIPQADMPLASMAQEAEQETRSRESAPGTSIADPDLTHKERDLPPQSFASEASPGQTLPDSNDAKKPSAEAPLAAATPAESASSTALARVPTPQAEPLAATGVPEISNRTGGPTGGVNPAATSPGNSQGGLPLPIIGAILAGVGLLAAIAFAIGNRTPQTATTPAETSEQVSNSATSEGTGEPAPSAPTASPNDSSEAASTSASSATTPNPTPKPEAPKAETPKPDAKPAETAAKPAEKPAAKPAKGEVALGVEVKGEPAWFFVEVDGFVAYEGIASDFKENFKGKEIVLGSSRPDLIQVSVDGKQATTFGKAEEEKTQTFTGSAQ